MTEAEVIKLPPMPDFSLEGRRALVSGASRGFGRCCAAALADAGAQVTMLARSNRKPVAVAKAIGPYAAPIMLDIADIAAMEAFGPTSMRQLSSKHQ